MKSIRYLLISVVLAVAGVFCLSNLTGCTTAPSERTAAVRTLQAIGETARTSMEVAAKLRVSGKITERQWQGIAAFHDNRFMPIYRVSIAAVSADLSSPASPDLIAVVTQLAALVAELEKRP
jgi:hypothetical protein